MHITLLMLQYLVKVLWQDNLTLRQLYAYDSSYRHIAHVICMKR